MTDSEFVAEVLRLDQSCLACSHLTFEVKKLCDRYREEISVAPVNTAQQDETAICAFEEGVRCGYVRSNGKCMGPACSLHPSRKQQA